MSEMRITRASAGVFPVLATPFAPDGAPDHASLSRMVERFLAMGAHGFTILGVMGEADRMDGGEASAVAETVMAAVAGACPVIHGVSAPGLDVVRQRAEVAMAMGAAGVMLAPPRGLGPDERIVGWFDAVLAALGDIPVCYQDYPQITGAPISLAALQGLFARHANLVMLKHEASPGLGRISALNAMPEPPSILVGNNALFIPLELARGADGIMTGFPYPDVLVEVWRRHQAGDLDTAEDLYDAFLPLIRYETQPGLAMAGRKYVLHRRGFLADPALRGPAAALSDRDRQEIERLMARCEARAADLGVRVAT
ncbi:MAG: dihydrodipicolinate synthase family protein [Pseudomonadota bacterium]